MQCSPEAGSPDVSGQTERAGDIEIKVESPAQEFDSDNSSKDHPRSTLIEFPGVSRRAEPPWRKELSRRVREAQERKAREAADAPIAIHSQPASPDPLISQLELVPQLPTPAMNQIVENALRRVGRARRVNPLPRPSTRQSEPIQNPDLLVATEPTKDQKLAPAEPETAAEAEVQSTPIKTPKKNRSLKKPQLVAVAAINVKEEKPRAKTVSLTADIEKVAVSYLESHFPSAVSSDHRTKRAGFGIRLASAICDLLFIGLLTLPFAAGIEFADGNWNDPRIRILMVAAGLTVMILYLTLLTAVNGQTWGMRLFSIRTIDIRTGLLPTGAQSVVRALTCLLSIPTLGLGQIYALIDRDKRTVPDRFSKTTVVRD